FLVISAGTRNHFAMDLGLDRDDPATCLDALTSDGVEQRIDLGVIGGRTFVNNASFGAYAEVVESPAYRDDKRGTTLQMLPDILSGHRGAKLTARAGEATITGPQALPPRARRVRGPRDRPRTRPSKPPPDRAPLLPPASSAPHPPAPDPRPLTPSLT